MPGNTGAAVPRRKQVTDSPYSTGIWKPETRVNALSPPQCLVDVTAGTKVQVTQGQCRRETVLTLGESLVCDGCSMTITWIHLVLPPGDAAGMTHTCDRAVYFLSDVNKAGLDWRLK